MRNDYDYKNNQMCIVTGPNIDIAIKLIKRMKALFEPKLHVTFDSKETVLELNGCSIEAYPSNHIVYLYIFCPGYFRGFLYIFSIPSKDRSSKGSFNMMLVLIIYLLG